MTSSTSPHKRIKPRGTVFTILLSVCLFLSVICACLICALVLIGKNLASHSLKCSPQETVAETENKTRPEDNSNGSDTLSREQRLLTTSDEISVRLTEKYPAETDIWRSGWRLPREVEPEHYEIFLNPNLSVGIFTGTVNITITIKEPRDHLILHSQFLNITKVLLFSKKTNEEIEIINFHEDAIHQLEIVDVENILPVGVYYLYLEYNGSLKNRTIGLYRSSYNAGNGDKRYIATSKLEPTYARQAFPCFDEPKYKANFTVHIVKPNNTEYIALSNMQQAGPPVKYDESSEIVSFNKSVPMSTYLVCFIVCDFKYKEDNVSASVGNDVLLRVYATPEQQNKVDYALDMAKKVTAYLINYFQIEYPLPKLDLIAIPDFVSGAMEHWGLVTFRETALLYDQETSSATNMERVATVVAHELAHMWFGNLVTLKWWNDLWLNEGFATYMQYKVIDNVTQDWGLMDQFLIEKLHPVLQFDATLASHPIIQTVVTPDQITEIFDAISYNKGASILRMLETTVGENKFQLAVTNYLNKYKYSNAVTKDLLDEIHNILPEYNIHDFMDSWTVQMGFPIVSVKKNNQDEYVLTQKRFLADPDKESESVLSPLGYKWIIPITYITNNSSKSQLSWFNKTESELKLTIPNAKWVKFNVEQKGYYRVNYSEDMWKVLAENIKSMSVSDRSHLIEDSFSIARSGQLSYSIPMLMTKSLSDEQNYVVWAVASSKLKEMKNLLINTNTCPKLEGYVQKLINTALNILTWKELKTDTHLQKLARATVIDLACSMKHSVCINKAGDLFKKWLNNSTETINVNLKSTVYHYGMVNATEDDWNKLLERYKSEIDANEKLKLMNGLSSIQNKTVLSKFIELAQDENIVRSQDYLTCLYYISLNPEGTQIVWEYVRKNWNDLVKRFTLNDRYLGSLIPQITSSFSTKEKLQEMEDFFKEYPDAGAGTAARKRALEIVANNIKWTENYMQQVENWLNMNSQ